MTSHPVALALIVSALSLSACMPQEVDPNPEIRVVGQSAVSNCKLVGNFSSSSSNYGLFKESAEKARLNNAKMQAHKLGATHMVLNASSEADHTTTTTGQAYSCIQTTSPF